MTTLTNKRHAQEEAARRAAEALAGVDLPARCARLGLPAPGRDGLLRFRVLGRMIELRPPFPGGRLPETDDPPHPFDRLLALHYLLGETPVRPTGEWISFRRFPGGQFYWGPFKARTGESLVRAIGDDLPRLRRRLSRLDHAPLPHGDVGARVHVIGALELGLVYRGGDEEFPPEAEVLFDRAWTRVYGAEDAAAAAGRLCAILAGGCVACGGFGLCERGAGDHCRDGQ